MDGWPELITVASVAQVTFHVHVSGGGGVW